MKQMTDEQLDREERWSLGCALGEAVWIRMCAAAGQDPKDETLANARDQVVSASREAFFAMDGEGLEGLAEWLDMESWFGKEVAESGS